MRKLLILLLVVANACTQKETDSFILVKGGTFKNTKSNIFGKNAAISDFYMSRYEVTQKEWVEIMGSSPSKNKGDSLPVESVNWYDCVEYCNKLSLIEGLTPYYNIDRNIEDSINESDLDSVKWKVTFNVRANGYRLPTEAEWEYAAGGGQKSRSYTYSGSNNIDEVAWYWRNSGDKSLSGYWSWSAIEKNHCRTRPVGLKMPNELGLYDMSGNVREWCEDWYEDYEISIGFTRALRGGGWFGGDQSCISSYRGSFEANGIGSDTGFRVCRSISTF